MSVLTKHGILLVSLTSATILILLVCCVTAVIAIAFWCKRIRRYTIPPKDDSRNVELSSVVFRNRVSHDNDTYPAEQTHVF